jgi:hypothetical protein
MRIALIVGLPLIALALIGCGDLKTSKNNSDKIKDDSAEIKKSSEDISQTSTEIKKSSEAVRQTSQDLLEQAKLTNQAIHRQILSGALEGLIRNKVSVAMAAPFAAVFAEEAPWATTLSIAGALYLDSHLRLDLSSNLAASALSGLLSPQKFAALTAAEIDQDGVYKNSALEFVGGRYSYIKKFLYAPLVAGPGLSLAQLKAAVPHLKALDLIAKLPYLAQVPVYNEKAIPPSPALSIDAKEAGYLGDQLKKLVATKLDVNDPEVKKTLESL